MKYKIDHIDDDTIAITEKIGGVHCYLLIGKTAALLIDTGNGAGNLKDLVSKLTSLPITLVNTHAHLDHIGGNHLFDHARLPAGEEELAALHTNKKYIGKKFKAMLPLKWRILARILVPYMITTHKFNGSYDIVSGEELNIGGRTIQAISLPGHSPSSMCFYDVTHNYVFCGDSIVDNTVLLNLDGCFDTKTYYESLLKLEASTNADVKFYPGHNTIPLDKIFLDQFKACAEAVINNEVDLIEGMESGSLCYYAEKNGVRIALKR